MADALTLQTAIATPKSDPSKLASSLESAKNKKSVHDAATKFEAMYMQEMLGHMFEDVKSDGPFGGGHGEEVFRSLMVEQYGKKIADSNQLKISQTMETAMLKMQEEQQNPRGIIPQIGA